jgi:colanic acid/amylovoran biosynthesis protein
MTKNVLIYGNGSFFNRGCEAIYKGTLTVLKNQNFKFFITSKGTRDSAIIDKDNNTAVYFPRTKESVSLLISTLLYKFKLPRLASFVPLLWLKKIVKKNKIQIALFSGGDNYCYPQASIRYYLINKSLKKLGVKIIFWNASFENEYIDKQMLNDLNTFDHILVRESLSYDLLIRKKLEKVHISVDTGFFMTKETPDNLIVIKPNSIGVNLSSLILSNNNLSSIILFLKKLFLRFDYIYLFPHVYGEGHNNDDLIVANLILSKINDSRVFIIKSELSASKLKYLVSSFEFIITSRTHASIAAYSQNKMALVFGYSIKSKGIATDIFGDYNKVIINKFETFDSNLMFEKLIHILENVSIYEQKLKIYNDLIRFKYDNKFIEKFL